MKRTKVQSTDAAIVDNTSAKTQPDIRRGGPPKRPLIGTEASGLRRPRERGEPITYLEVHVYDASPHDFIKDHAIFAYISDSTGSIQYHTLTHNPMKSRKFNNQTPEDVSKSFAASLIEKEIKFAYHAQDNSVHIYSFPDVKPNNLVGIVNSMK